MSFFKKWRLEELTLSAGDFIDLDKPYYNENISSFLFPYY